MKREAECLRVGLGFVRDWGEETAEEVVQERERNGPFRGLADLVRRAPPRLSRDGIENLVWVGGGNAFGLTRRELLWQVGLWLPPKNGQRPSQRTRRQLELPLDHAYEHLRFADLIATEQMLAEYHMLGFAAAGHPFRLIRDALPDNVVSSGRFPELDSGLTVRVAGLVVARQRPQTAKGYIFVLMEDEAGMINVIVRPDVYEQCRAAVRGEPFLLVDGTLQKDGATMNVIAERVEGLKLNAECGMRSAESKDEPLTPHSTLRTRHSPWAFLRAIRTVAPDSKDWG